MIREGNLILNCVALELQTLNLALAVEQDGDLHFLCYHCKYYSIRYLVNIPKPHRPIN
jgi:hypothetical protein